MSSDSKRATFDALRFVPYSDISSTPIAIGDPIAFATRILKITNTTDANMIISLNYAANIVDVIPAGSGAVFDFATNKIGPVDQLEFPVNTQVFVSVEAAMPSGGNVYVTVVYASSN